MFFKGLGNGDTKKATEETCGIRDIKVLYSNEISKDKETMINAAVSASLTATIIAIISDNSIGIFVCSLFMFLSLFIRLVFHTVICKKAECISYFTIIDNEEKMNFYEKSVFCIIEPTDVKNEYKITALIDKRGNIIRK